MARLANALLLDPRRFAADARFRERAVAAMAAAPPGGAAGGLRDPLLFELSRRLDLLDLARVEFAWGAARRAIADRRLGAAKSRPTEPAAAEVWPELRLGASEAAIGVSIYSLGSRFFSPDEAMSFLRAVRGWAPERAIAVLTDDTMTPQLAKAAADLDVHVSRTRGHVYSPWPRDPMSFLAAPDGGQVAVLRPNRQPGRESDSLMGLELIQDLPEDLDARFGPLRWTVAPIPFHNGHMLPVSGEIWLSIHSLEQRILEILGADRVPEESFTRRDGVARYVEAARRAATEVERLYGKPTRFVHPLPVAAGDPAGATAADGAAAMQRLGGGAGYDLDSLVTVLPRAEGSSVALVGSLALGSELIAGAPDGELESFRSTYGLAPAAALAAAVAGEHRRPGATGLQSFLDLVAAHLAESGLAVHRLPLLLVPIGLLENAEDYPDEHFLIGWNNVVLEGADGERRAEGFAAKLESGDARARALFTELGYRLELLPPLVESVLRNGGYRCASNHIRDG